MNKRFKELRNSLGLTQTELATKLSKTLTAIQYYEYGTRKITDGVLLQLNELFNVNINWMRTGNGEMFCSERNKNDIDSLYKELNLRQTFIMNAVRNMGDEELDTLLKYIKDQKIIKEHELKYKKEQAG